VSGGGTGQLSPDSIPTYGTQRLQGIDAALGDNMLHSLSIEKRECKSAETIFKRTQVKESD
jgi:hypothetical protein